MTWGTLHTFSLQQTKKVAKLSKKHLQILKLCCKIQIVLYYDYHKVLGFADVAQVVAHILGKDEVMGPNPIISSSLVQ